jgi:hypothetical protein
MTVNARHRKHYKSGACLQSDPWATDAQIGRRSRRFAVLLDLFRFEGAKERMSQPAAPDPFPPLPPKRGFFQTMKDWLFPRAHVAA